MLSSGAATADLSRSRSPSPSKIQARSKTSCLKCRSRKAKCGALPPDTCFYCKKNHLECVWPEADKRSARERAQRPMAVQGRVALSAATGDHLSRPRVEPDRSGDGPSSDVCMPSGWVDSFVNTASQGSHSQRDEGLGSLLSAAGAAPTSADLGSSEHGTEGHGGTWNLAPTSMPPLEGALYDIPGYVDGSFFHQFFDGAFGDIQMDLATGNEGIPAAEEVISIKVSRAHGRTAFIPGTIKVPFRIRVQPRGPPDSPTTVAPSPNTSTDIAVLKHLLGIFNIFLSAIIPCVDSRELEEALDREASPSFLMYCVAAAAARFSNDPRVALRHLEPSAYGDHYYERANLMLGNVVKIPLRETVVGFTILAYCADSSTGTWTMAGLGTRMAVDLGLHRADPPTTDPNTAKQNRLCFWTLLILDTIVSFGVGRETSIRPTSITQIGLSNSDMGSPGFSSPFAFAAQMMLSYGVLMNLLNTECEPELRPSADLIRAEREKIMRRYHELPIDMTWSTEKLRTHNATGQATMFLHLHLWFHTVLSNTNVRPLDVQRQYGTMAGVVTPSDALCRSGSKMVTEYLALCDVLNPAIYYTQRFLGQPLFTAARVILQELRRHTGPIPLDGPLPDKNLTTSLLSLMADSQIAIIRKSMSQTGLYWRGAAMVKDAIEHLVQGRRAEDQIWSEDESYAIEMYSWSLPGKYRINGAHVN